MISSGSASGYDCVDRLDEPAGADGLGVAIVAACWTSAPPNPCVFVLPFSPTVPSVEYAVMGAACVVIGRGNREDSMYRVGLD